jgi:hypothetical protein
LASPVERVAGFTGHRYRGGYAVARKSELFGMMKIARDFQITTQTARGLSNARMH